MPASCVSAVRKSVLDEANRLLNAFCGDPLEVERIGSEFCRGGYEISVCRGYDIVVASPGGHPKDINLYQAQKGLAHATPIVRQGGDVILLAECPDGHGEEDFYRTMKRISSPAEIVGEISKGTVPDGSAQSLFLWARSLAKAEVHMCSAMGEELSRLFMVSPAKTLTWALQPGSYDGLFTSEFPAEPFGAEDIASIEGNGRGFTMRVNPAFFQISFGVLVTFGR